VTENSDIPEGYKVTELGVLPEEWDVVKIIDVVDFTKKPRSLSINPEDMLPFIPMEMIPENNDSVIRWQEKKNSEISSGTFVFKGDLIVAKITPCFENGKQAILDNLPTDYAYTTTEVWPMHPKEKQISIDFLSNYLRNPIIRNELTTKMEGSTNRQRLPREALQNLVIPLPPLSEQHTIAHVLSTVQGAKENTDAVIAATKALKVAMMRHLFTYGPVPPEKAETVVLNEEGSLRYPEYWTLGRFDNFIVLQRGFDITKDEQRDGNVPVISSSGIKSYHNTPRVKGPGVTIGRKGTLGKVFYVDCDYWPHDTSLWVKDFKGNNPKFVYYLLTTLNLKTLDTGTSNPTLNRNYVHALKIALPSLKEQKVIVDILSTLDQKLAAEQSRKEALDTLFTSLLHDLMTAKIRVSTA
jgi:type I restriction enzyme, S subunit